MLDTVTPVFPTPASGMSQIGRRSLLTGAAAGMLASSAMIAEADGLTDNFETISALLKQYRLLNAQRDTLCDRLKDLDKGDPRQAPISLRRHATDPNDYDIGVNGDCSFRDAMSIDVFFGPMIANASDADYLGDDRAKSRLARLSGDWQKMRHALLSRQQAAELYRKETGVDQMEDDYERLSDDLFAVEQRLEKIPCLSWRDVRLKLEMIIVDYSWCEQKDWINLHRRLIASMAPDIAGALARA